VAIALSVAKVNQKKDRGEDVLALHNIIAAGFA
jgi:hypothetical protein